MLHIIDSNLALLLLEDPGMLSVILCHVAFVYASTKALRGNINSKHSNNFSNGRRKEQSNYICSVKAYNPLPIVTLQGSQNTQQSVLSMHVDHLAWPPLVGALLVIAKRGAQPPTLAKVSGANYPGPMGTLRPRACTFHTYIPQMKSFNSSFPARILPNRTPKPIITMQGQQLTEHTVLSIHTFPK
jgi:hypothetical protein